MTQEPCLVHLTTVIGSFHGRLLIARLASEGIRASMSGSSEGPYPLPAEIKIFVEEGQLALAREVLLGDDVDATFIEATRDDDPPRSSGADSLFQRLRRKAGS